MKNKMKIRIDMKYIEEETIKKIEEIVSNKPDYCDEIFEEKVTNEMLDILRNDKNFQEFSKQTMNKIILGEL